MNISFANLDHSVTVEGGRPCVLRVENPSLFARICQSFISKEEEEAVEPYTVWSSDGDRLKAADTMLLVPNPFDLPWEHRSLQGNLHKMLISLAREDEELMEDLQDIDARQKSLLAALTYQLEADYGFTLEWSLASILKTFKFGICVRDDASLLDRLIGFIDLAGDMRIDETLVFINLKTFLSKTDLFHLYNRLFFRRINVLLLENQAASVYHEMEREYVVDVDFIEYKVSIQNECLSSSQGRICSDGFGAVAF